MAYIERGQTLEDENCVHDLVIYVIYSIYTICNTLYLIYKGLASDSVCWDVSLSLSLSHVCLSVYVYL